MIDTNWHVDGLCRTNGVNPEMWFPARNDNTDARKARSYCRVCPVQQRCLDDALRMEAAGVANSGIWGGMDENERAELRKRGPICV